MPTLSCASPASCLGPGTPQRSVSCGWLTAHSTVPARAPSSTGPWMPLGRLSPAETQACLSVFGQWVNGAPCAPGTSPQEAVSGGLRMSRLSLQGLEKGGSDPAAASPLPAPGRKPSPPTPRGPRASVRAALPGPLARLASLPGHPASRAVQQKDRTRAAPSWPSAEPREPRDRSRISRFSGPRARPQGAHGSWRPQPGRWPPHSPRHGRARAPPPSPRPGRLHRSAQGGGAERAQVTMTKQSRAPAVSE